MSENDTVRIALLKNILTKFGFEIKLVYFYNKPSIAPS
jgi:hypothetical protein